MKKFILILMVCFLFPDNQYPSEDQINTIIQQSMELVWQKAMEGKQTINQTTPNVREELLSNLCSSAPNTNFYTHCDLSDSLTSATNTSAKVFVSDNEQSSWTENTAVDLIGTTGYESTWAAVTNMPGMNESVWWYLSGSLDSGSLGLDFGQATVSQSPYNMNNDWPAPDNLFATLASDDTGETNSDQDIVSLKASYSDDKLYTALNLAGSCCNAGGFFGPWNLYVIAIVNPDAQDPVAYAYGYGSGGFGQLYPAIYKIDGDLSTGEVAGFEVLSENFNYNISGNTLQASSLLSIITNDSGWGEWPNSFNGVGLVGVTISAGLSGLDISTEILDTSDVGVLVMTTQNQTSNTAPVLSGETYDDGMLCVTYTDAENNLATMSDVAVDDIVFMMTPDSHVYSEGANFCAEIGSGYNVATLWFSDGAENVSLEIELGGGCQSGDANGDGSVNVLDIVSTTNLILSEFGEYNPCSDVNADGDINVLDIVALVNLILGSRN